MKNMTQATLKEYLYFDSESGRFFWNKKFKGVAIGSEAGSFDAYGYGQIRIDGEIYKEHRLVWLYVTGDWPDGQIDHCNHDRRDNRFENLRVVDNAENHKNRPMQRNNTTGCVGVSFCKRTRRFEAYITVDGRCKKLGQYSDVNEAIAARQAANQVYGYHPNHGIGVGKSKAKTKAKLKTTKEVA